MTNRPRDPRHTSDADHAEDNVAPDGRSLERLAKLTGTVLKVPVEEVRELEQEQLRNRTRRV